MAIVRADAMFKLYPAKAVYKQKVKLRPNEHHYENEGEDPYIKYSCQICEQLAERVKGSPFIRMMKMMKVENLQDFRSQEAQNNALVVEYTSTGIISN